MYTFNINIYRQIKLAMNKCQYTDTLSAAAGPAGTKPRPAVHCSLSAAANVYR